MFSDLWNKIKEIVRKMLPKKDIENVLHITPMVSDRMADAILLWSNLYEGKADWLREPTYDNPTRVVSLGLPSLIASEKARMATLEMKSQVATPMEQVTETTDASASGEDGMPTVVNKPIGSTERANFLNKNYYKVLRQIRKQLEYGIAKGGLVIKPYVVMYNKSTNNVDTKQIKDVDGDTFNAELMQSSSASRKLDKAEIEFDFVQADRFFPLSFDSNGKVVEAAFVETKTNKAKERVYIRLEYHKIENRTVTVQNLAFESTDMSIANSNNMKATTNLGKQVPLSTVPEWANMQETTVIDDVDRLLFAYFRMPEANTVDPYSPLGVSGYSRAVNLIKDADMQYSRMLWEFEGGELAIDVDRNALEFVDDGRNPHSQMAHTQQRLFRKVDLNNEETYNVFAPELRDASLARGLNIIFMRIEDATGLSRGTISDVTSQEAKTATELKILKQRSYATNADIQYALQDALEDLIYVMDVYCTLYELTPPGDYEVSFEWDDSIIVDSESELSKRITLVQNGLSSKLETRMWYFGETENQARTALQQVDKEAEQAAIQNAQAESLKAGAIGTNEEEEDDDDYRTNRNTAKSSTKSPADTSYKKKSSGKQADSLDNPDKSKKADAVKGN